MTELLIRIFIKNHSDPQNPQVRKNYGTLSSVVGIAVNVFLSVLKLVLGFITFSVAIMADALNNLSDAGASIVSLISFKLSAKPADRSHPFGHARIEYIASMIVSFLILLVGFEMFSDSVTSIFSGEKKETDFSIVSIVLLASSILFKLWLAAFYNKIAKKIDSSVIKASSTDSLTDCISTVSVLICSIIVKLTNFEILDAIVGVGVSIFIFVA